MLSATGAGDWLVSHPKATADRGVFSPGRGERTHFGSLTGSSAWSPGRVVSEPPEGGRGCAILRWNQGLVLLPCGQLQDCNFPGQSITQGLLFAHL